MLTNKQSLILCAFVVVGFCLAGALGILDNFVVIAILVLAFVMIIVNIILYSEDIEKDKEDNL